MRGISLRSGREEGRARKELPSASPYLVGSEVELELELEPELEPKLEGPLEVSLALLFRLLIVRTPLTRRWELRTWKIDPAVGQGVGGADIGF